MKLSMKFGRLQKQITRSRRKQRELMAMMRHANGGKARKRLMVMHIVLQQLAAVVSP